METTVTRSSRLPIWLSLLLASTGLTFFLFFIDEGYYDLRWMMHPMNWVAFGVYVTVLFLAQALVALFWLRNGSNRWRWMGTFLLGSAVGLGLLFTVVFG